MDRGGGMLAAVPHRLCLNMIVRNESTILERCLRTMAPFVDCYVITDTGSTDDTVAIIERVFAEAGIPGEVHHTVFDNFAQARNEALDAARASDLDFDYIVLCDADMELTERAPDWRQHLDGPVYMVMQRSVNGGLEYPNIRLVHRSHPARYVGATHEYLDVGGADRPTLEGLLYLDHAAGANRVEKFERDIRLLTTELERDPDNPRSVFYLANSYFDSDQLADAERWYRKRMEMGGYADERFISMLRLGRILRRHGEVDAFWRQMLVAYDEFPSRAESLHELALHAHGENRHQLALTMASIGMEVPKPASALFVQADVYEWRLADLAAISLYWLGRRDEALARYEEILDRVPAHERARIEGNIDWCRGTS